MTDDVLNVIYDMARGSPKSIKSIAEEIGKPYSTLMRELDPGDRGAKLGVELLLPLMKACNSIAPIRFMAGAMHYRVASTRAIHPDKASFHEELLDTYQALVEYHRAMIEGQKVEVVAEYREVLIRQLKEDFAAYMDRAKQE